MHFALRLAAALMCLALPAGAGPLPDDLIRADILPGWRQADGSRMAGLRIRLAPGWKTYWRSPGEAGIPPEFNWAASDNLADVQPVWPSPMVFDLNGYRTLGYQDELILPLRVTPARPGQPVHMAGQLNLGVCHDICVPVTVDVAADLSEGTTADPLIRQALARQPRDGKDLGLPAARCAVSPLKDGLRLSAEIALGDATPADFAVIELTDRSVWVGPVESRAADGRLTQVSDLVPSDAKPFALNRSAVRLTVFRGTGEAIEMRGCAG